MKTRISIYSALAMCGIFFTQSCTKDEVRNETASTKSGLQEIMVSMPQENAESRISLNDDGTKITATWNEKDIIYLVPKSATSADAENIYEYVCNDSYTNTALFTLSESENGKGLPEGEFYAFYGVKEIGYDNGITYTLESPMEITSTGNNDISSLNKHHAMMAESEYRDNTMSSIVFKSLMSIIEIYTGDISEYTTPQTMTLTSDSPEGFITEQTFMAATGNSVGEPTRSNQLKVNYYDASRGWTTFAYFMLMPQDLSEQTMQVALNGIYKSETLSGINFREGVAYTKKLSLQNAFGSEGTEHDPWVISTPEELLALSKMSYDEINGKYVNLGNDIDMSGIEDFQPIGLRSDYLQIFFDGKDYTISNLNINNYSTPNTGLFYSLYAGDIKNLTLQSVRINSNSQYVGLLVGKTVKGNEISNIKIQNSSIYVNLNENELYTEHSVIGGIAGSADCTIKDINIDGNSSITYINKDDYSSGFCGGIIGEGFSAILEGEINTAASLSGCTVGGIIGNNHACSSSSTTVLTNTGDITARECAGGIAGTWCEYVNEFLAEMHNYGDINITPISNSYAIYVGGFIGFTEINLNNINMNGTSSGNITVNATENNMVYAGWKVGYSHMPSTIDANAGYTGSPVITATSNGGECYINGHLQNGATSDGYEKEEWN